jgi:hypothetical protein
MGYTIRGSYPGKGKIFFCSPKHPDCFRSPSNLLINVNQVLCPGVKQPGLEAAPPLYVAPRLRMNECMKLHLVPICMYGRHRDNTFLPLHPVMNKSEKMYFQHIYFPCLLFALYSN